MKEMEQFYTAGVELQAYPVQDWVQKLGEVSSGLSRDIAGREQEFLDIGNRMSELSRRSRELSRVAVELAEQASGKALKQDMEDLDAGLSRMLQDAEAPELQGIIQSSQGLAGNITHLDKEIHNFRPILKRLRMLAISIRIESATLGEEGRHFMGLASDVEGLGQKTQEYVQEVGERAQGVFQELREVQSQVDTSQKTHYQEIKPLLERVSQGSSEIKRLCSVSEGISSSVAERADRMKKEIGEIVSSVQFHDITRQQVEHVIQSLEEVQEVLQTELNAEQQESFSDISSWLRDVCSLQIRQLESTNQGFTQAMDRMGQSLSRIHELIREQEQDLQGFTGLDSESGDSVLGVLERDATALVSGLNQASDRFQEVKQRLDSMVGVLGDMQQFLSTLEDIGEEIALIALNSSVKAAHTGERGRTLGVLANEIHRLSQETKGLVSRVISVLEKIVSAARDFGAHADHARTRADREQELSQEWSRIIDRLSQSNEQAKSLYRSMQEGTQEFLEIAQALEGQLDLRFAVERDLKDRVAVLRDICTQAEPFVWEQGQTRYSQRLRNILESYTMESERSVYQAFTEKTGEEWDKEEPEDAGGWEQDTDQESEDNVELF